MTDLIEATRARIGALLAPHRGRHQHTDRVRPYVVAVAHTPPPEPYEVVPLSSPVRPYVLASERRAHERADRTRLGLAVLLDISERVEVSP